MIHTLHKFICQARLLYILNVFLKTLLRDKNIILTIFEMENEHTSQFFTQKNWM